MSNVTYEERPESRRERIERLEAELNKARQDWIAHKRTQGGTLRALIEECLPSTAGKVMESGRAVDGLDIGMSVGIGPYTPSREALIDDIFNMLADNSGRFIRAMNPLS